MVYLFIIFVAKCIDKYIDLRVSQDHTAEGLGNLSRQDSTGDRTWTANSSTYKRLELVVNKMFDRCFEHKQYKQALGIAIETRRLVLLQFRFRNPTSLDSIRSSKSRLLCYLEHLNIVGFGVFQDSRSPFAQKSLNAFK